MWRKNIINIIFFWKVVGNSFYLQKKKKGFLVKEAEGISIERTSVPHLFAFFDLSFFLNTVERFEVDWMQGRGHCSQDASSPYNLYFCILQSVAQAFNESFHIWLIFLYRSVSKAEITSGWTSDLQWLLVSDAALCPYKLWQTWLMDSVDMSTIYTKYYRSLLNRSNCVNHSVLANN